MEVQKLIWVHIFVLVAIQFILIAEIGFCSDASPEPTQASKSDAEKYISQLYFKKYDSLLESDFQDFIAEQLPLGFSAIPQGNLDFVPRFSISQRHLIGEGSHRRLSSSLGLSIKLKSTTEQFKHKCKIIIIERLPSGVFADPFELQHLVHRGVLTEAAVFGDTNLELPTVVSNRSVVEIHMDVDHGILSGLNSEMKVNIEIPLHARYAPLEEVGFSRVEFQKPNLFMHCRMEEKPDDESCVLNLTSEEDVALENPVWEVPCGTKEHLGIVSSVTFISAVVSATFIVMTSVYYPHFQKSKLL